MSSSLFFFGITAVLALVLTVNAIPQKLRLQPELDAVDVEVYLKNPRLFEIQVKCVVYDGPCDAVGRFLKPRVARALLGECEFCTPKQTKDINRIISFIQEEKPELYRELAAKFIADAGIAIPDAKVADEPNSKDKVENEASMNVPVFVESPSTSS